MINFSDKTEKTNIHLLTKEEAEIFGIFIYQESLRHRQDIIDANNLISELNTLFDIDIETLYRFKAKRCKADCELLLYGVKCVGCSYD